MGLLLDQDIGSNNKNIKVDRVSHDEISQHTQFGLRSSKETISKRENDIIDAGDIQDINQTIKADVVLNAEYNNEAPSTTMVAVVYDDSISENLEKYPTADCNRCKRKFAIIGDKVFKMCEHCRVLQRQRSKRWQRRTKQKDGVCTRCGTDLSEAASNYSLCQHCRDMLRSKKANRYLEGKCVHCSGPNDEEGTFKVCRRCREKDKLRRLALEQEGLCNRCSYGLAKDEKGHKICQSCRLKKKKPSSTLGSGTTSNEGSIVRNVGVEQLFTKTKHLRTSRSQISSKVLLKPNSTTIMEVKENGENLTSPEKSRSSNNKEAILLLGKKRQIEKVTGDISSDDLVSANFSKSEDKSFGYLPNSGRERHNIVSKNCKKSYGASSEDSNQRNTSKNEAHDITAMKDLCETQTTNVRGHVVKKRKVALNKLNETGSFLNVTGECDKSESSASQQMTIIQEDLEAYRGHNIINEKPLHENMMLPQSFSIPHDHSQLNRQLKQLSQYTSHSSTSGGDIEDDDDESVLVNLDGLEEIGMGYDLNDVEAETSTVRGENVEYEEEKETMLRHVRAVQAGLLSSTGEPSDAEIAAAVEAVAVAAAVARSRGEEK